MENLEEYENIIAKKLKEIIKNFKKSTEETSEHFINHKIELEKQKVILLNYKSLLSKLQKNISFLESLSFDGQSILINKAEEISSLLSEHQQRLTHDQKNLSFLEEITEKYSKHLGITITPSPSVTYFRTPSSDTALSSKLSTNTLHSSSQNFSKMHFECNRKLHDLLPKSNCI